jgi:hypothetical protein
MEIEGAFHIRSLINNNNVLLALKEKKCGSLTRLRAKFIRKQEINFLCVIMSSEFAEGQETEANLLSCPSFFLRLEIVQFINAQ